MKIFILFILIVIGSPAWGLGLLPFDKNLELRIENLFFENQYLSKNKIELFKQRITKRRDEIIKMIRADHLLIKDKNPNKLSEEINKDDLIKAFNLILSKLDSLENLTDSTLIKKMALNILELEEATKVEGQNHDLHYIPSFIKNLLKTWKIKKVAPPLAEASDLVDPKTGLFFTPEELDELKEQDYDISLLNPASITNLRREHTIEDVNMSELAEGKIPLYSGIEINFPSGEGVFKKLRKTQTKPKFDIVSNINGTELTYKIKVGAEVHSEITAGLLLASLGYSVDLSKYARNFKMYLPKKVDLNYVKKEWNSYYGDYDFDQYVKEIGVNEEGLTYVVFTEVIIEAKTDELIRLGPWSWGGLDKLSRRDARGLLLFNMWIGNIDIKESENNKLILKENVDGELETNLLQHDNGYSFGRIRPEMPGRFNWNLVKKNNKDEIIFNYRSFQRNNGFKHVTYSDLKWMARQIGELKRTQIQEAIQLGGWPESIQKLLLEKLISRRNDLIIAFDLKKDYPLIPFNKNLSTEDGAVKDGVLLRGEFPNHTTNYNNEVLYLLNPVFQGMERFAIEALQSTASSFDKITITGEDFGIEKNVIGEIEITFDREILPNKKQTGANDKFLVEDQMNVRFGLGYGLLLRGKANYVKTYKLIYPVKERRTGLYHNNFILNVLLPYHARTGKLPKSHILIMEDSIEAEGGLEFSVKGSILGTSISALAGTLSRTIIAHKDHTYKIFRDKSLYREFNHRLYADFLLLRIPIWKWTHHTGLLDRDIYEIDPTAGDEKVKGIALDNFMRTNDEIFLIPVAEKRNLQTKYSQFRKRFTLLNLFRYRSIYRVDHITNTQFHEDAKIKDKDQMFQIGHYGLSQWTIIGNSERSKDLKLTAKMDSQGQAINPTVHLKLTTVERVATSEEISKKIIPMINHLANDKEFISFSPHLHSANNLWGETIIQKNLLYNEAAIHKILETDESRFWNELSQSTGISVQSLKQRPSGPHHRNFYSGGNPLGEKLRAVLYMFKKGKQAKNSKEKLIFFMKGLNHSIWKKNNTFQTLFLSIFNRIVGEKNLFLSALIGQVDDKENKYPSRLPLYNEQGEELELKYKYYEFDFTDIRSAWEVF